MNHVIFNLTEKAPTTSFKLFKHLFKLQPMLTCFHVLKFGLIVLVALSFRSLVSSAIEPLLSETQVIIFKACCSMGFTVFSILSIQWLLGYMTSSVVFRTLKEIKGSYLSVNHSSKSESVCFFAGTSSNDLDVLFELKGNIVSKGAYSFFKAKKNLKDLEHKKISTCSKYSTASIIFE
ncbi:hypothetical protein AOG25_08240 [Vibrio alginolyticus]|nr:hypothetical protein AOG25_08240 [Vibrio alginolyticus]